MNTEKEDFCGLDGGNEPYADHVYYHAYAVMFGETEAMKMLKTAKEEWDT